MQKKDYTKSQNWAVGAFSSASQVYKQLLYLDMTSYHRRIASCRVISRYFICGKNLPNVATRNHLLTHYRRDMSYRGISRHIASYRVLSRHIASYRAISRHISSYRVVSRSISQYLVVSRRIALYRVVLRHIASDRIVSPYPCFPMRHCSRVMME